MIPYLSIYQNKYYSIQYIAYKSHVQDMCLKMGAEKDNLSLINAHLFRYDTLSTMTTK